MLAQPRCNKKCGNDIRLKVCAKKKLETFEVWLWRKIRRSSWTEHKTNSEVLEKSNEKEPLWCWNHQATTKELDAVNNCIKNCYRVTREIMRSRSRMMRLDRMMNGQRMYLPMMKEEVVTTAKLTSMEYWARGIAPGDDGVTSVRMPISWRRCQRSEQFFRWLNVYYIIAT